MAGLRFFPVLAVLFICYQDAFGGDPDCSDDPITTLKNVLNKAVKEDVLTEDKASKLVEVCSKHTLEKKHSAEVLEEAMGIGWKHTDLLDDKTLQKLEIWASEIYPETFDKLEILSCEDIAENFETEFPDIENQLAKLSGKHLKAVEVAATVLIACMDENSLSEESAARALETIVKSAQDDVDCTNALKTLKEGLEKCQSQELITDLIAWFITRVALNEGVDKDN